MKATWEVGNKSQFEKRGKREILVLKSIWEVGNKNHFWEVGNKSQKLEIRVKVGNKSQFFKKQSGSYFQPPVYIYIYVRTRY